MATIRDEDNAILDTLISIHLAGEVPIDPTLPELWDQTPNDERPPSHRAAWGIPYVQTMPPTEWRKETMYEVRRLDGGAWDRSTWHGSFAEVERAIEYARELRDELVEMRF